MFSLFLSGVGMPVYP